MALELRSGYWVIHTDHYKNGTTMHTKQVMKEVFEDGKIRERPMGDRYTLSYKDFERAMNAYDWTEVLGKPEDYIKEENK